MATRNQKSALAWACMEMQKYRSRRDGFTDAFLRPPYQYTSLENDTVSKQHELDYLKEDRLWTRLLR